MELTSGNHIGPYRLIGPAGHGGMGVVWQAHDTVLDRPVAIKILHADDERSTDRIVREARLAARLTHPNVVTIYEARREGHSACIVMEWIAGVPLAERIPAHGLVLQAALGYAIPIARALEAAHAAGIVHRDLKPSNVMVAASGATKLLDFGIAKSVQVARDQTTDTIATAPGHVVGTAAYMSPEQVRGHELDSRSDIFSFGALLYELLTGRRAFAGGDMLATMSAVLHQEPPAPARAGGEPLSEAAANIVMRCLRKDPSRRFQTAADLRAALEDLAETPRMPAPAIQPWTRRRWIGFLALPLLAAGAVGAWLLLSRDLTPKLAPLQRFTFDAGFLSSPAFSADGQLIAYASDRAARGNLDIWVRQVAGGNAERLTAEPGVEWNPQFSPDGTRVLFLSGDQNIVEIPVLGRSGQSPRPVAADAGPFAVASSGAIAFVRWPQPSRSGAIFLVRRRGAAAEPFHPECRSSLRPVWSPEGDRLLFWGQCEQATGLWSASLEGGPAQRFPLPERVRPVVLSQTLGWLRHRGQDGALFAAAGPLPGLLWLRPSGEVTRVAETSAGLVLGDSNGSGTIAMIQNENEGAIVWHTPAGGEPREIAAAAGHYAVSRDGRRLVYGRLVSAGAGELVIRDLVSGDERIFASHDTITSSVGSIWPQIAHDGRQVVYRVVGEAGGHYVLDLVSGETRLLTSLKDFQLGSDWSADSTRVVGECPPPAFGICEVDARTGQVVTILRHETDQLLYPSWSRDERWLAFGRRRPGQPATVWVAPVGAGRRIGPENAWVRISGTDRDSHRPRFSLDGNAIYYVAGAAGLRRVVRQPIDVRTKAPVGGAAQVLPFPVELLVVTGGFGPYPLVTPTERGLFASSIGRRGALFLSRVQ